MDQDLHQFLGALADAPDKTLPTQGMVRQGPLAAGLEAGTTISQRYELIRLLGKGGFGAVWEVRDTTDDQRVALKINHAAPARFEREITTLARLDHPNITWILDEGVAQPRRLRFFTMELVDGEPLSPQGATLRRLLTSFDGMLAALAHAHARGFVHCDLKPDNVFVVGDGRVKVLDFGIVRLLHDGTADSNETIGTPPYMSPEQAGGQSTSVGPASDLYAVGVMLYEALCGRRPFYGTWYSLLVDHVRTAPPRLPPLAGISPDISDMLADLVDDLLQKSFGDRPEFATDVRARLAPIIERLPQDAPPVDWTPSGGPATHSQTFMDTLTLMGQGAAAPPPQTRPTPPPPPPKAPSGPFAGGSWRLAFWRTAAPMGRENDLEALKEAAEATASQARPRAVILEGPSGTGKRCTARWLAETVHETGLMRVLRVGFEDSDNLPAALHIALHRHLRLPRLEHAPLLERIRGSMALGDEDAEALARFMVEKPFALDAKGGASWPASLMQRALVQIASHPTPRGLLIWINNPPAEAEPHIAAWIGDLLEAPNSRIFTVWTRTDRPSEALDGLASHPHTQRRALAPLSHGDTAALALHLMPDLSEAASNEIAQLSQGNPLFLRELLLHWRAGGGLRQGPEGLTLDEDARRRLPERVESVFVSHIEAFLDRQDDPEAVREALFTLALLGQSLETSLMDRALADTGLRAHDLEQEGWLTPEMHALGQHHNFSSTLLQDTLISQAAVSGMIGAYVEQCVDLRLLGGIQAMARSDWASALQHLQVGWGLLDTWPEAAAEDRRGDLLDAMARVRYRQRDVQAVRQLAVRLGAIDGPDDKLARAALWRGAADFLGRDLTAAEQHLRDALAQPAAHPATKAIAQHLLGQTALAQRDAQAAKRALERACDELTQERAAAQSPWLHHLLGAEEADAVRDLAELRAADGDHAGALSLGHRSLALYRDIEDVQGQAYAHMQLARTVRRRLEATGKAEESDIEGVRESLTQARGLMASLDDRRGHALVAWEGGALALVQGFFREADGLFEVAGQLFAAAGDPFSAALCDNNRGEAAFKGGARHEAIAHFESFGQKMRALGDTDAAALSEINIGWVELSDERLVAAKTRFEAALSTLDPGSRDRAAARVGLACAALLSDAPDTAQQHLQAAAEATDHQPLGDPDATPSLKTILDHSDDPEIQALARLLLG